MTRISYNSRRGRVRKTLKDYLIPVSGIIVIFLIIFGIFSGNDEAKDTNSEIDIVNSTKGLEVLLDDEKTEAYIMSEKNEKTLISGSSRLLPSQKLIIKEGSTTLNSDDFGELKLNKMGELTMDEKGGIKLVSSDLWINSSKGMNIETIYLKAKISAGSVISISQNEALSTIYVISGSAEVSNLSGKKTLLGNLQKLTISRQNASNKDLDLSITKDNIDEFFKNSEWYVKNNGDSFIKNTLSNTSSGSIEEEKSTSDTILLDDLRDESVVSSSKLIVSGKYFNDSVFSIVMGEQKATLDQLKKTFTFDSIILDKKVNDLVLKLYDEDENLISKEAYTIYYNGALTSSTQSNSNSFEVKNYQVDGSKFIFTAPGTSPYTTTESLVTIRGQVPAGIVSKVTVNGFQLGSFNGTTWRYHADASNDNLKDGTNVYEVKYYGEGGKIIYTNSFVIIKNPKLINTESEESVGTGEIVG